MRLLVLGASGGTGRWVTRIAAQRGHTVTAMMRAGATVDAAGASMERGDVTDAALMHRIVPGHDAVLSCLGLRRAGRNLFAPLLSPADLTERAIRVTVDAMRQANVRRIVVISAGGVGDSIEQVSWPVKKLVTAGNVAVAYEDLARMERVLEGSGLDWLAVRPVTLMNGQPTGRARPVSRYGLFSIVRRADLATWMLDAVQRPEPFTERKVLLAST